MIVIYGASGHTGSLIAAALSHQGLEFAMAGRDRYRLEERAESVDCTDIRVAAVHETDALVGIFEDADVVINCAGPFATIGEPVVKAALQADSHYLDTTGEQLFVRQIYERYESAARQKKRVIVNACAFEVALGDWAAHVAAQAFTGEVVDAVHICYAVDDLQTSKGTRLSLIESIGKQGCRWDHDRWIHTAPGAQRLDVSYPEPFGRRAALSFPSPEVITVPRHVSTRQVQCFMSLGQENPLSRAASMIAPVLAPVMTPILGSILRSTLGSLAQTRISQREEDDEDLNRPGRFAIVAEAHLGDEVARCVVAGEGIYRISAGIACLAAERLLNEGELAGVLAPSELLDAADALGEVAEQFDLSLEMP